MENGKRFAVFALNGGGWERRTATQRDPEPLRRFVQEDEAIRALPETDWDIFGGPKRFIAERRIPKDLMRDLVAKRIFEAVDLP